MLFCYFLVVYYSLIGVNCEGKINKATLFLLQLGVRLDDLLELVCTDIQADTVEEAETALRVLQEKVDTIGKYTALP